MLRYLSRRLILAVPTLLGVGAAVFLLLRVLPGDVVEIKLKGDYGANVTPAQLELARHQLGLDRPLAAQFADWMAGALRLDLGRSMWTDQPVAREIGIRFPLTLELAVLATLIGVALALPLGTLAAVFRNRPVDYLVRLFTLLGLAAPGFWLGMLILLALLDLFDWLPPVTYTSFWRSPGANLAQLIWPALAVGYRLAAVTARMVRASLLDVLDQDYVRTARAKGLSERLVVGRHALRNALLPTINLVGLEFAFLIGGLVITEEVFNLNGVGKLFVDAVLHSDFTLIQGMVLLFGVFYVGVNLLTDLLGAALDPRLREGR